MERLTRAAGLPFTGQSTRAVGTSGGGGFGLGLAGASIIATLGGVGRARHITCEGRKTGWQTLGLGLHSGQQQFQHWAHAAANPFISRFTAGGALPLHSWEYWYPLY